VRGSRSGRALVSIAIAVVIVVSSVAAYELYYSPQSASCQTVEAGTPLRTQLSETTFGGVTEYALPGPDRWPNAITNASDGSVWLAEQEVPGMAHFFPGNKTLVEYAWPGYPATKPPECAPSLNVSGMAIWDGRVWAADELDNRTVGLDPSTGGVVSVNSTEGAPFPYWLAAGPDGDLWFTSNNFAGQPSRLGRILPNMTLKAIDLVGLGNDQPIQLDFVNATFAILATLNQADSPTTHACVCTGDIYSFNPSVAEGAIAPTLVGGGYTLRLPTSLAFSNGSIWVTQHATSSVVRYDYGTRTWTTYPTSIVPWIDITLPYVIQAEGGSLWFNEHYANKIAVLNPQQQTVTEFSEANPPIADPAKIQNDLSIAPAANGLWFTSMTGNYIGFLSASYNPGFGISVSGNRTIQVAPGGSASFDLKVSAQPEGIGTRPMPVNVSDSEDFESIPQSIKITPSVSAIPQGVSDFSLGVNVSVGTSILPGDYTLAVTVTNGDVQQTAYLFLVVA
jgi:streptogramin lyase